MNSREPFVGVFRIAVTDAYGRACAITGEHSLPALEAAHIKPYANEGPHDVANDRSFPPHLRRLPLLANSEAAHAALALP